MNIEKILINQILREEKGAGSGCLMLDFEKKIKNWDEILKIIDPDDLYDDESKTYGYETDAHVTVLYGFTKEVTAEHIQDLFENINQFVKIQLTGIEIFESDGKKPYDVVKFSVQSDDLNNLHELCKDNLPNKVTYPDYKPHMTIAYVKAGTGKRYIKEFNNPIYMEGNTFIYSTADKKKTDWKIKKKYRYEININENEELVISDKNFPEDSDYKNGIWYHGRSVDSTQFSLDYVGREGAIDQEGCGFYFTNKFEEAHQYTGTLGDNGIVMKCKLNTSRNRTITPKTRMNPTVVRYLIQNAPDLEMNLTDWDENPRKAFEIAFKNFSRYPDAKEAYQSIEADFYRRNAKEFCINLSKFYDALLLDQDRNFSYHIIVYNPNIIQVLDKKQA